MSASFLLVGCPDEGNDEAFPKECGLPSPRRSADTDRVPTEFLLEGSAVRRVAREDRLLVVALNVPFSVTQAYQRYNETLIPPRYQLISRENEVFEAEIYLRALEKRGLVAVQIRRPHCDEASSVSVVFDNKV